MKCVTFLNFRYPSIRNLSQLKLHLNEWKQRPLRLNERSRGIYRRSNVTNRMMGYSTRKWDPPEANEDIRRSLVWYRWFWRQIIWEFRICNYCTGFLLCGAGHVGWGISWYINGLLIPEINVVRGRTYTFVTEGGLDAEIPAKYHPFYITDDPVGGFQYKTPEEKAVRFIWGNKIHPAWSGTQFQSLKVQLPNGRRLDCNWSRIGVQVIQIKILRDLFCHWLINIHLIHGPCIQLI